MPQFCMWLSEASNLAAMPSFLNTTPTHTLCLSFTFSSSSLHLHAPTCSSAAQIENLQEQLRDKDKQLGNLKDRVKSLQTDSSNTDTALATLEEALSEKVGNKYSWLARAAQCESDSLSLEDNFNKLVTLSHFYLSKTF